MISYVLTPNPVLQLTDNDGNFIPFGTVETLDWDTRLPKPTYFDPAGQKPRPNPFPLDSIGRAFTVYWEDDKAYYLRLRDRNGNTVWQSSEPYTPGAGGGSSVTTNNEVENLFLNGQMRFFEQARYEPIPSGVTENVAEGGWSFEKDGTNPDDKIEFLAFTLDETAVDATPIYYFNYVSTTPGTGETKKDFRFNIKDVRSLSNEEITVAAAARSDLAGTVNVTVLAVQNFGTASASVTPSAPVETTLGVFSLNTAWQALNVTETLPDLIGKTLGDNGDDYLQIVFRFPLNTNVNIEMTNFYLKRGASSSVYPYETYAEVQASLNRLNFPEPNDFTNFPNSSYPAFESEQAYDVLTLVPSDNRLVEDWRSPIPIGATQMFPSDSIPPGWIQAAGQELLQAGQYNRLYNVPFSGGKLFGNVYGIAEDNTGAVSSWSGSSDIFSIFTTNIGVTNIWSAGTSGFTFIENVAGHASVGIRSIADSGPTWTMENTANGAVTTPTTDTSMTLNVITLGSASTPARWEFTGIPATSISGGQYIAFVTTVGSYYVWFTKDGAGTDPALPGFAGSFQINLVSGNTAEEVALITARAIDGFASYAYTALSGNAINAGNYFEIAVLGQSYAIYYRVDGAGTAPVVPSAITVPIEILSTDTAADVSSKTATLLSPLLWKMPDWRGSFTRAWDDGRGLDPDAASRTNRGDGTSGDNVGTFQADEFGSHAHAPDFAGSWIGTTPGTVSDQSAAGGDNDYTFQNSTNSQGGNETRPKNYYFNFIVKY